MVSNAMHPVGLPVGSINTATFGTDGVRGQVGTALTPALVMQLGFWASHVLPREGPVLIGKDSRQSGDMVSAALTAGLTAAGKEVWLIGLCPTPAVPYLIKNVGASGGIMVSASHNPPEDNGIKIFNEHGSKIDSEQQRLIESRLRGELSNPKVLSKTTNFGTTHQRTDLLNTYQEGLISSVENKKLDGVRVVLDLCWGSATACGAEVFKSLGADLTVLHDKPDGRQINVGCGSTHLAPLRKAVFETQADMGFAFDGDSDRMLAVDRHGRLIDGDHVLYLWGSNLQDHGQLPSNRLVATVMSNLGFERAWKARGGLLERTPVGDQNVHSKMISTGAALGGEQSGHILSAKHGLCGDGLLTALQIATICHEKGLTLEQWRDESFQAFPQKLVNVPLPNLNDQTDWESCEPIQKAVNKAEAAMGEDGRVLLRLSGTEPLIRVMVEAKNQLDVDSWSSHIAKTIEEHLDAA
ncbi:phosphoglucosamine mutase [Prochlorococcus sp. MIT 1307]|uniref:phosphoglucosamine mutase n=1 Tax=Prochlorococcus sp. MIT 1307 TaxID=3096219 RepID=UPI002A74BE06|nr:phosphoglucosamine mutase [Prochlorococcus sp. MIT 1307]